VEQALGSLEQVRRLRVSSGIEGVSAGIGGRAGAGLLLLGLRRGRGRGN
jgi:hypothetical protein